MDLDEFLRFYQPRRPPNPDDVKRKSQFLIEPSAATSSAAAFEAGSTDSTMPQNVRIRLNVGGTVFHTSLHTLMEGARHGGVVFQCLCVQILGPGANTDAGDADGTAAALCPQA